MVDQTFLVPHSENVICNLFPLQNHFETRTRPRSDTVLFWMDDSSIGLACFPSTKSENILSPSRMYPNALFPTHGWLDQMIYRDTVISKLCPIGVAQLHVLSIFSHQKVMKFAIRNSSSEFWNYSKRLFFDFAAIIEVIRGNNTLYFRICCLFTNKIRLDHRSWYILTNPGFGIVNAFIFGLPILRLKIVNGSTKMAKFCQIEFGVAFYRSL